jgi:acyl-CoA thioester hydrolase
MPRQRIPIPLRWSDMDAYGHVNNVQFLRLLEDARVLAFHAHSSDDGGNVLDTGVVVARHEIDYLRPLHYRPEPVSVDLWVSSLSAASFEMQYEVLDDVGSPASNGERIVYARAESTLVLFDLTAGRPRRFTDTERENMTAWVDDRVPLRREGKVESKA